MSSEKDRMLTKLIVLWILESVIEVKKLQELEKTACGEVDTYVIDYDKFKEKRQVTIPKNGNILKTPPSCDALIIETGGQIIFIEMKRLRELIMRRRNIEEAVKEFNLEEKIFFSYFMFRELVRGYDKNKLENFLEEDLKPFIKRMKTITSLFNLNSVEFYIIIEDGKEIEKLWASLAVRAQYPLKGYLKVFETFSKAVKNTIPPNFPYKIRIRQCSYVKERWSNSILCRAMEELNGRSKCN